MFLPSFSCTSAWQDLHNKSKFSSVLCSLFLSIWCTCNLSLLSQLAHRFLLSINHFLRERLTSFCCVFFSGGIQFGLFEPLQFSDCHLPLHLREQKIRFVERWECISFPQFLHFDVIHFVISLRLWICGIYRPFSLLERNLYEHIREQVCMGLKFSSDLYLKYENLLKHIGQILVYNDFMDALYHKKCRMVKNANW
jgi:hypothetical protein